MPGLPGFFFFILCSGAWLAAGGFGLFTGCTAEPVETDLLLPVEFSNVPDGMVLTYFHADKIEVRIQAHPRQIDALNKETILYQVDLYTDLAFDPAGDSDAIDSGTYLLPVDRLRIPMDPAIQILEISPSYLSVRLEKKVARRFKVHVPLTGDPSQGHMALAPACDPPGVILTGAQSQLDGIQALRTKPVDLTGANETFKKEVPLDLENLGSVASDPSMIIVTVPVQPRLGTRTLADIPIRIKNSPARVRIEPPGLTIEVKGPQEALGNKAAMERIYAFMDLKDLKPGVYARHACIDIPVDLVMTAADPQVFTVKIE